MLLTSQDLLLSLSRSENEHERRDTKVMLDYLFVSFFSCVSTEKKVLLSQINHICFIFFSRVTFLNSKEGNKHNDGKKKITCPKFTLIFSSKKCDNSAKICYMGFMKRLDYFSNKIV